MSATTSRARAAQGVTPLGERPLLVDEVTHHLRDLILRRKIPAGTQLVQADLAVQLGVSRTPLRESMRLLEQDGLVRVSNGNRTVEVVNLQGDDLRELYEIREVVDGLAAKLLATRGVSDEAERALADSVERMEQSVSPFRGEQHFLAHLDFHTAIVNHCGNERLKGQLLLVRMTAASLRDEFAARLRPGRSVTKADAAAAGERAGRVHREIYEAILSGDGQVAERVARAHIRDTIVEMVDGSAPPIVVGA